MIIENNLLRRFVLVILGFLNFVIVVPFDAFIQGVFGIFNTYESWSKAFMSSWRGPRL